MHERTPLDAFRELTSGELEEIRGIPWKVTNISGRDARLLNGVEYCAVQVTFANGLQYGIEAFGEQGAELREEALLMKHVSERLQPLIAV